MDAGSNNIGYGYTPDQQQPGSPDYSNFFKNGNAFGAGVAAAVQKNKYLQQNGYSAQAFGNLVQANNPKLYALMNPQASTVDPAGEVSSSTTSATPSAKFSL